MGPTRGLVVLYDAHCPICRRAGNWLGRQPQLVPIEAVAAGSEAARERFPDLDHDATLRDITVVADTGAVYTGDSAWLICLWALDSYRALSIRLAQPGGLRGAARQVVTLAAAARRYTREDGYGDDCDADACQPAGAW
jgi:predicted DCC family thiol-disulfide oxidoreductase YuxK